MDDAQLEARGVAALGARRKMLKTFERVRAHCDAKVRKPMIFNCPRVLTCACCFFLGH